MKFTHKNIFLEDFSPHAASIIFNTEICRRIHNICPRVFSKFSDKLKKSEQIILLQNRRGYSLIQQCLDCGEIKMCKRCAVTLPYHLTDNSMHCHYCEEIEPVNTLCSKCNSSNYKYRGSGTQRVENVLEDQFPGICILRMDMDTVRKRGAHEKILQKFHNVEADVLLGTQMIAKGLDFENVTLVGVINADSGLFFPDFRDTFCIFPGFSAFVPDLF